MLFFSLIVHVNAALRLLPEKFVDKDTPQGSPKKLLWILKIMVQHGSLVHTALASVWDVFFWWKLERPQVSIYSSWFCAFHVVAVCDAIKRGIFRSQTVRGRLPRVSTARLRRGHKTPSVAATIAAATSSKPAPFYRRFLRSWRALVPVAVSSVIAIGYAHATSALVLRGHASNRIETPSSTRIALFIVGSLVLKVATQEGAKRLLLARPRSTAQTAAMTLIATPTLVVDIQVRVVLLQLGGSANSAVATGTGLLAVTEIAMRFVKMKLVLHELRSKNLDTQVATPVIPLEPSAARRSIQIRPAEQAHVPDEGRIHPSLRSRSSVMSSNLAPPGVSPFQWARARRLLALHASETYADMYAEYLALGCSYAVLVIFSRNPHYNLYRMHPSTSSVNYWALFGLQVAVEIGVDAVSSALEVALGLEVEAAAQHTWAAAGYMVALAFVNIAICAGLYLDDWR